MRSHGERREDLEPTSEVAAAAKHLERFFKLSVDLVCIAGMDGYFKRISPSWTAVLGYTNEELRERPFADFVHEDDRAATSTEAARLADGETVMTFENRYRCKDGSYRWLQWTCAPYLEDQLIYAVARDITVQRAVADQLRDRETRLSAIVQSAPAAILTVCEDGTIESYNPSAERIFGRAAKDVLGQSVSILLEAPFRGEDGARAGVFAMDAKAAAIGRELVGRRSDGAAFPAELTVAEMKIGERRLFLVIVRDISERKKIEGMSSALLAREAHQQGRLEMAAGILHDIGNALTGIGARAVDAHATIERDEATKKLSKTAEFLRASSAAIEPAIGAAKARALVDIVTMIAVDQAKAREGALDSLEKLFAFLSHAQELLTTHRAYSGAGSGPARETMSLQKLLFDAQMMMSDAVANRGGVIVIRCDPGLPHVVVERIKLMQIFINLIKNAVESTDASPPGRPPEIILTAGAHDRGIRIEVSDNGAGFDPADTERLFTDGYSTKGRGSGLGLAVCLRTIRAMGGTLSLYSEGSGRGAVARITIPKEMLANG